MEGEKAYIAQTIVFSSELFQGYEVHLVNETMMQSFFQKQHSAAENQKDQERELINFCVNHLIDELKRNHLLNLVDLCRQRNFHIHDWTLEQLYQHSFSGLLPKKWYICDHKQ